MAFTSEKKNPLIRSLTVTVIMCIVTFCSLLLTIVLLLRLNAMGDQVAALEESLAHEETESLLLTHEEAQRMVERASDSGVQMGREAVLKELRTALQNRNDFLPVIRRLYSDELMISDGGVYRFAAINKNLKMTKYDPLDFYTGGGGMNPIYSGKAAKVEYGIDVSEDTRIDSWEELSPGKSFVIVRIGKKSAATGEIIYDKNFEENLEAADKCGMSIGVYFLSGAKDQAEAEAEADQVIEKLEKYREEITYPVVMFPGDGFASGRGDRGLSTDISKAFADRIEEAGYKPMIGGEIADFVLGMELDGLEDCQKFVIDHGLKPYYPYEYSIWQYGGCEADEDGFISPGLDMSFSANY